MSSSTAAAARQPAHGDYLVFDDMADPGPDPGSGPGTRLGADRPAGARCRSAEPEGRPGLLSGGGPSGPRPPARDACRDPSEHAWPTTPHHLDKLRGRMKYIILTSLVPFLGQRLNWCPALSKERIDNNRVGVFFGRAGRGAPDLDERNRNADRAPTAAEHPFTGDQLGHDEGISCHHKTRHLIRGT